MFKRILSSSKVTAAAFPPSLSPPLFLVAVLPFSPLFFQLLRTEITSDKAAAAA